MIGRVATCKLVLKYVLNSKEKRKNNPNLISIDMSLYLTIIINVNRDNNMIETKDTDTSIFNIDIRFFKKFVGVCTTLFTIISGVKA